MGDTESAAEGAINAAIGAAADIVATGYDAAKSIASTGLNRDAGHGQSGGAGRKDGSGYSSVRESRESRSGRR